MPEDQRREGQRGIYRGRALKLSQFLIVVRSLYGSRFDSIREQVRIESGQARKRERDDRVISW